MTWFVYRLGPIDNGWYHLRTVKQTLAKIAKTSDEFVGDQTDIDVAAIEDFLKSWESAKDAASENGWEGDFRHEPAVFWLPGEVDFVHGFVFKQDNNGTTFVVSPQQLPAAEKLAY